MMNEFNIGDIVREKDKIGVIINKYHNNKFDWEVAYFKRNINGCYVDCVKNKHIVHYDWKPYPKTWKQLWKIFVRKLKGDE
jgi:hypothetical protein